MKDLMFVFLGFVCGILLTAALANSKDLREKRKLDCEKLLNDSETDWRTYVKECAE